MTAKGEVYTVMVGGRGREKGRGEGGREGGRERGQTGERADGREGGRGSGRREKGMAEGMAEGKAEDFGLGGRGAGQAVEVVRVVKWALEGRQEGGRKGEKNLLRAHGRK